MNTRFLERGRGGAIPGGKGDELFLYFFFLDFISSTTFLLYRTTYLIHKLDLDLNSQYYHIWIFPNLKDKLIVVSGLLSLREDDTWRVGAIFVGLFLTQWHTNLRGWGYIFICC